MKEKVLAGKFKNSLNREDILDGNQINEQKKKCIFLPVFIEQAIWQKSQSICTHKFTNEQDWQARNKAFNSYSTK